MPKLRGQISAMSIGGDSAGPNQDLQNPIGVRGIELMEWFFHRRCWRRIHEHEDGEEGVDNEPPYHAPIYLWTYHSRPPLEMAGGTVFYKSL